MPRRDEDGRLIFEFDTDLPPYDCNPNGSHGQWSVAARARRDLREHVGWLATEARGGLAFEPGFAVVELLFMTKGRRRLAPQFARPKKGTPLDGFYHPRDLPNAISAWKGGFDGLKDGGLIRDDSHEWMDIGRVRIDPNVGPGVRVTVRVQA